MWTDGDGVKHISSIPRHGFRGDGELRRAYDPNSVVYQHRRLRESLAEQAAEIERQRLAEQQDQVDVDPSSNPARAPKEGIMSLRDLIRLEQRGGRYQASPLNN